MKYSKEYKRGFAIQMSYFALMFFMIFWAISLQGCSSCNNQPRQQQQQTDYTMHATTNWEDQTQMYMPYTWFNPFYPHYYYHPYYYLYNDYGYYSWSRPRVTNHFYSVTEHNYIYKPTPRYSSSSYTKTNTQRIQNKISTTTTRNSTLKSNPNLKTNTNSNSKTNVNSNTKTNTSTQKNTSSPKSNSNTRSSTTKSGRR